MSNKSVRELELIIQRLNTQLESKNEQIAELNAFIQSATENTQELIRNFRAFCIKVLESELAYGDISSRDLEAMSLNDLLSRARNMLKQNQEKARGIYDTFKERLTQKNQMIQGLTDQVTQLKFMIDNAEKMFSEPYEKPEDEKRTEAYLLDTNTPVEALKPAIAMSTVVDENERVVDFAGAADKDAVEIVSSGKMYIQNLDEVRAQMKDAHWDALKLIVESGVSEFSAAKHVVREGFAKNDDPISPDTANRHIKHLVTLMIFSQEKINTGIRWFNVLNLTDTGRRLYIDKFLKNPIENEYQRIVREHGNAVHGYTIKDVAQILKDTGRYRSVSMSRKGNAITLPNNKMCIPDVVCCQSNSIEYYEVECGNHHQSDFNDKCNKLKSITQNLYFVTQNKEIAENRLKPQIEKWIASCGREQLRFAGVTVYLTSISDLAMQKWSYVFDMKKDQPICIESDSNEPNTEQEGETSNDEFSE